MNENYSTSNEVEEVMPSFFWTIASSEGHQLINKDELVRIIKFDEMTKNHTELYRKQVPISKALADNTKLMMPGITASTLMDGQGKQVANILKPTYWLAVDIDKIPDEKMQEVIAKADKDPYVMARYVTASGHGLRILARYKPFDDPEVTAVELFDVVVRKAMDYFSILLGVPADEKCCDITRMCGLAHDPTAYFCWNSKPFELESKDIKRLYFKKSMAEKYERRSSRRRKPSQKMVSLAKHIPTIDEAAASIEKLLETWGKAFEPSRHNDYVYNFGLTCLKYNIDQKEATDYADQHFSAQYPKTVSVMNQAYKHQEQRGTWQFMRKGESYGKKPSMKMLKQWLSMRYEFHRNEVTGYYEVCSRDVIKGKFHRWTRMDDNIENSLWIEMEEDGLQTQQPRLHSLINSDFSEKYNPLLDFLTSLPAWDGKTDYIQMLADRIHIADTDGAHHTQEDFRYFFKKWFVAMVVTWVTDTVVGQTILIFVGKGGLFKTTFFDKLLPKILHEYFINESTASYTDKDFMEAMASKALMCLDEFETAFGKNLSAFKSCVTKLFFSIRRPYDKYRSELPHRASLSGTTNSQQFITDEENRRYSPWIVESIDSPIDHPIDYQNVYAQALALGKEVMSRGKEESQDWTFWLTRQDIDQMRNHNRLFMVANYAEEQILKYYRVPEPDTPLQYIKFRYTSEILEKIGCNPALRQNLNSHNIGSVMARLGFKKIHKDKGNGWAVIEKEPVELNSDAAVDPTDTFED